MDALNHREAKLRYGAGRFDVLVPGSFVKCAVTGGRIPLEELRYWNVDRQEAYANGAAALQGERRSSGEPSR